MNFALAIVDSPERKNKEQHPNSKDKFLDACKEWKKIIKKKLKLSDKEVDSIYITFHGVNLDSGIVDIKGIAPVDVYTKINGKLI